MGAIKLVKVEKNKDSYRYNIPYITFNFFYNRNPYSGEVKKMSYYEIAKLWNKKEHIFEYPLD